MFVRICAAAILSSISAGAAWSQDQATASVGFVDAEGMENGTAEVSAIASGGVLVRMEVKGLPAGEWVAVHFHETGTCDHTTKHESAGGHFNPGSKEHGFNAASGPHAGDMRVTCQTSMSARMAQCGRRSSTPWQPWMTAKAASKAAL